LSDEAIAEHLTQQGYRSPQRLVVLPSTVRTIRLRHRVLRSRSQSHPRHVAGQGTGSQPARALDVSPHWLSVPINNGTLRVAKDRATGLYLFPDHPTTLDRLQALRAGTASRPEPGPGTEYQDACSKQLRMSPSKIHWGAYRLLKTVKHCAMASAGARS